MSMDFSHRLYLVFLQAYLSFNVVINLDLYFIMNNPFYPREKRLPGYYVFVLISSITTSSVVLYLEHLYSVEIAVNDDDMDENEEDKEVEEIVFYFLAT